MVRCSAWAGLALAAAASMTGCGQKGPLYLGPPYPSAAPAAAVQPAAPVAPDDKSKAPAPVTAPSR